MAWEHGFVIEKIPTENKKTSCRKCVHYDSSDKSCSKKGYYLPVDGYFHWKTCEYSSIINPVSKSKKNTKSNGKLKESKKTKLKENSTPTKKKVKKANSTNVHSYGSIKLKSFTVSISGTSTIKKPVPASKKQKENSKPSNTNDSPSYKSYQLVCGYKLETLPKDVNNKLVIKIVHIPIGKQKFKCKIGYDHFAKKAYLLTYLAHKPFTELKKQFKNCTIYTNS